MPVVAVILLAALWIACARFIRRPAPKSKREQAMRVLGDVVERVREAPAEPHVEPQPDPSFVHIVEESAVRSPARRRGAAREANDPPQPFDDTERDRGAARPRRPASPRRRSRRRRRILAPRSCCGFGRTRTPRTGRRSARAGVGRERGGQPLRCTTAGGACAAATAGDRPPRRRGRNGGRRGRARRHHHGGRERIRLHRRRDQSGHDHHGRRTATRAHHPQRSLRSNLFRRTRPPRSSPPRRRSASASRPRRRAGSGVTNDATHAVELEATLQPGQHQDIDASAPTSLRIGNPPAVTLAVDDVPVQFDHVAAQPLDVQFTGGAAPQS